LLPIVRRQSDPSPPGPSISRAEDDGLLGSETIDEDGGGDERVHASRDLIQRGARQEEKLAPLGLPAPNDRRWRWGRLDSFGLTTPRMLWVRSVKSTLLLFKVCFLFSGWFAQVTQAKHCFSGRHFRSQAFAVTLIHGFLSRSFCCS
jgi:hypothetical protein